MSNYKAKIERGELASDKGYAVLAADKDGFWFMIGPKGDTLGLFRNEFEAWEAAEMHADVMARTAAQRPQIAPINPIVHAIPEGMHVTVFTAHGRFSGVDDTSGEEADKGIFVLFMADAQGAGGKHKKTYLIAADIVGFEILYEV